MGAPGRRTDGVVPRTHAARRDTANYLDEWTCIAVINAGDAVAAPPS